MTGSACTLLLSTIFFWGGDLFGNAYVLSMPFYYSFLLPATVLATGSVCGELVSSQSSRSLKMLVAGLLALASAFPAAIARCEIGCWVVASVGFASALTLMPFWGRLAVKWLLVVSLPLLFLASLAVARTGMFSQMLGHYAAKDEPVLEIASRLREMIPSAWSDQATMRFWYDDDSRTPGGRDRRLIGSFFLHTFGKLTAKDGVYVPFGVLDDASAVAIADNGPGRIVIFDQDPEKVSGAVSAISAQRLPYTVVKEERLAAGGDSRRALQVAILERSLASSGRSHSAKFSWHPMHRGRLLASDGSATEFLSSRIKWWDPLAEADLGPLRKGDRVIIPYAIRLGRIRFDLEDKGKAIVETVEKWPSDQEARLEWIAPANINDAVVTLRNRYPTGSLSRIRVGAVQVMKTLAIPE